MFIFMTSILFLPSELCFIFSFLSYGYFRSLKVTWDTRPLWLRAVQTLFRGFLGFSFVLFFFTYCCISFQCKFYNWIHVNIHEKFFVAALCVRLFERARTGWGWRREAWSSSGPAVGGSVQLFVRPASGNQPWSPASLRGLAGGWGLPTCPADSPHSLQKPHTITLKHPRSWHTVVKKSRKGTCFISGRQRRVSQLANKRIRGKIRTRLGKIFLL